MSAVAHVFAFLLATTAALVTMFAIVATIDDDMGRIKPIGYLLILVPLLIGLALVPITALLLYYLGGAALLLAGFTVAALFRFSAREEIPIRNILTGIGRELTGRGAGIHRPPPQTERRRGPQPPRKAVLVDRELAYDKSVLNDHEQDWDLQRWQRMYNALSDDEYEQLEQFWDWQRQTTSDQPQPEHTDQQQTRSTPEVFQDQNL
jgi:hypothetical protein